MTTFVDTSGILAIMDASDELHAAAALAWNQLLSGDDPDLLTTSYVLLETCALIQARLGLEALQAFHTNVRPVLTIIWVDAAMHNAGIESVLAARRRHLSLVDCISFQVMHEHMIQDTLTVDLHFREQGFNILINIE